MEFKKRLKTRLIFAVVYACIGLGLIAANYFVINEFLSSLGLVFFVIGIARIVQYKRITKDEDTLKKREIAETDERNVMLWTQARSLATSVYIVVAALMIVLLNVLGLGRYADAIAYSLFGFIAIYWVCYFIISRKN